ncbi:MAG: hypothetical protein R2744_05680 [Bacteroidales bacterium]
MKEKQVKPALFYSFVGFLTVLGVSLHIVTYNTIPGQRWALTDPKSVLTLTFITVRNHEFILPSEKLVINHERFYLMFVSKISHTGSDYSGR